jgi:hypothetical protein
MRGRPTKEWKAIHENCPLPPLRQYWQQINRAEREEKAAKRARRKQTDKTRPKCRCDAYKFPHRPGGGLCRYPGPPAVRWQDAQAAEIAERVAKMREHWGEPTEEQMADLTALTTKPTRPNRKRYAGILRQICRTNGLHPIRDRALIHHLLPELLWQAQSLHRQCPWKWKYRNMKIIGDGNSGCRLIAEWQPAGPMM